MGLLAFIFQDQLHSCREVAQAFLLSIALSVGSGNLKAGRPIAALVRLALMDDGRQLSHRRKVSATDRPVKRYLTPKTGRWSQTGDDYFLTGCLHRPQTGLTSDPLAGIVQAKFDELEAEGHWRIRTSVLMVNPDLRPTGSLAGAGNGGNTPTSLLPQCGSS